MSIAVKFGYPQEAAAFGSVPLPGEDSAIVNSRQEMFDFIDVYANHRIEHLLSPMIGDLLVHSVRRFTTTFTPIENMKTALLANTNEEEAERHLIAFLHELQVGLPGAIETYKAEYPRFLFDTDPQTYTHGKPLLTEEAEAALREHVPAYENLTYATGPIGEYIRDFMRKCYQRAKTLLTLSTQYDGSTYESLSIEQLSRMAKVANSEIEGFKIETVDPSEYYYVTLHGKRYSLYARHEPIYIAYEDLENVTLSSPYGSVTDTKKVIKLTNMGDTAMVAKVGRTSPAKSPVNRADYSTRTQLTTPSEHTYTKTEVGKYISFEKMEKPRANSLPEIELAVGAEHVLSMAGRFSGEFIEEGYTLGPVDSNLVNVVWENASKTYTIRALARGFATFTITATNPAGSTPLVVDVNIT